jgi:peptidoglycan/xylan/chitin deacetylase (PgdA/CDA1 family)
VTQGNVSGTQTSSWPPMQRSVTLDRAVFVISLDTELAWGSFDRNGLEKYARYYAQVRKIVADLLAMFETHGIKATWAIVGHLFLESCSREGNDNHNHVLQPQYHWHPQGWLSEDPYSTVDEAPFFYAPDVIERILSAQPRHELASHTFTHAILGDPECTPEVAYSQLHECQQLARQRGREMVSLVFPRNSVGHLDVLCRLGFVSYRGAEENWYNRTATTSKLARLYRYVDKLMAVRPPCYKELWCYREAEDQQWLFNLPASMFYPPFGGLWNLVGIGRRVLQAKKGIRQAVTTKSMFHLWFHPFNLATSPTLLEGLDEVLATVNKEMQAGNLASLTMAETALHGNKLLDEKP